MWSICLCFHFILIIYKEVGPKVCPRRVTQGLGGSPGRWETTSSGRQTGHAERAGVKSLLMGYGGEREEEKEGVYRGGRK